MTPFHYIPIWTPPPPPLPLNILNIPTSFHSSPSSKIFYSKILNIFQSNNSNILKFLSAYTALTPPTPHLSQRRPGPASLASRQKDL
jgi:hypothetical protein